ncbi:MAG: ABC transporter ATP-binding protein, partial [Candidatus Methylopumilus sp.]|nr:ABC transporter ATP-binding protein [Candidatus Methylopumilus sp.]
MPIVQFDRVSKSFRVGRSRHVKDFLLGAKGQRHQSRWLTAVKDLTFSIESGETLAILGHNGSGKSTTLKLLAGVMIPSDGSVLVKGRVAPLLELGSGFHPDLTGRENIFLNAAILGVSRNSVKAKLDEIVHFSGIEDQLDTPVRFYSSGMFVRLGFAIAVNVEPEIVLVDEVLAVGDAGFQEKCLARMAQMKNEGRTIVLVTHSLDQALAFCNRAIVLSDG